MTFHPLKWIFYAPVAALPLLAALTINGDDPARAGLTGSWPLVLDNWVWLLAAAGLGIWFGWATSAGGNA